MTAGISRTRPLALLAAVFVLSLALTACDRKAGRTFSLAWSEYPSWSAFGVAHEAKLIDGAKGKRGPIEEKWDVDIVLEENDYEACMNTYASGKYDAVCITNMDALSPSLSVPSVAILPTSTSDGADALIVTKDITDVKQLKGKKVHGLEKSVSEYCFVRNLEILGEKEEDYDFSQMDPGAAASAMQQKRPEIEAIVVWNPYVLNTLNKRDDCKVLFDSTKIPGEILDMVVMSRASLEKPGGEAFACAVIDSFYQLNKRIADPATRDETLVALGKRFSDLDLESMKKVVQQTKFYATPDAGLGVLKGESTKEIMAKVVKFCVAHQIVDKAPLVGFGDKAAAPKADFRLDATFIERVKAGK